MVEVFVTNVRSRRMADKIIVYLKKLYPNAFISFDLEDRERILRVEAAEIDVCAIILQLKIKGYECSVLDH